MPATSRPAPKTVSMLLPALVLASLSVPVSAQGTETAPAGHAPLPYEAVEHWIEPFADQGFTWGGTSGIHVESRDRIVVLQRGETRLPDPVPSGYTDFPGSLDWNVLQGERRVWQNHLYVVDSGGDVLEVWDQWDHLFKGTDGPGPHRLRVSPYDPERRLWVVDETGHVIYVFSRDGERLLMTLGEKNVPGNDETHFNQPQDVAFLPDGIVLIADGLGNSRVVVRDTDGRYLSEFGEAGEEPGRLASVHGIAVGPGGDVYVVDRDNTRIEIFQRAGDGMEDSRPVFEHKATWEGVFGLPLDIIVGEEAAWVTDIRPPKIVRMDLDGNHLSSWLLPVEGPTRWLEMHSFAVDSEGNLYGTDNQLGRAQKLVPRPEADPDALVQPQYVPE